MLIPRKWQGKLIGKIIIFEAISDSTGDKLPICAKKKVILPLIAIGAGSKLIDLQLGKY
jgi:hypothetical protein